MKKILGILGLTLFAYTASAQQDPEYSMYMFNQIGINPAYAGTRSALCANLFYRNQWSGLPGAPQTEVFNMHAPILSGKIGLGFQLVSDQIGPEKTTSILTTYAYKIRLKKGYLSFGVTAGLIDRVIDYSMIDYKDQSDPYAGLPNGSKIIPTFDCGLYYYTKNFYFGLSQTHLNQPAYALVKDSARGRINAILQPHTFLTMGKAWLLNDNLVFRPSLMLKYVAGAPLSIDVNASFLIKNKLWLGISGRSGNAMVFMAEYVIFERMKLGYAYDLTIGPLASLSKSANEIYIGYNFNVFKTQTLSTRYF